MVADDPINVFGVFQKGVDIMNEIYKSKSNFPDLHLSKVNKVLTLQYIIGTITVDDDFIPIGPNLIFQRICLMNATPEELKLFLNTNYQLILKHYSRNAGFGKIINQIYILASKK